MPFLQGTSLLVYQFLSPKTAGNETQPIFLKLIPVEHQLHLLKTSQQGGIQCLSVAQ